MSNQTIDGVPRELLERLLYGLPNECTKGKLRALLDAPACKTCGDSGWVPEPFSIRENMLECPECKPAAQPQSVPVEDCETFEYQLEILGSIDRCDVACGSYGDKFHRWDDAGPYVEYEDHVKHIELYKQEVERLSKLYAEQPQGEPVACAHDWTDDGEYLIVCTKCGAQEDHDPGWRDMATAPTDGTMVRLLVEFEEHSTEDAQQAPTIGANNFDNDGEDTWRFAGWCWSHDHFTEGNGTPVGWLPMLPDPICTPASTS